VKPQVERHLEVHFHAILESPGAGFGPRRARVQALYIHRSTGQELMEGLERAEAPGEGGYRRAAPTPSTGVRPQQGADIEAIFFFSCISFQSGQ
jgi:hypothetical protein